MEGLNVFAAGKAAPVVANPGEQHENSRPLAGHRQEPTHGTGATSTETNVVLSVARVWAGDANWLVGSGGGTSASAIGMGGCGSRGSGELLMAAIRGSARWPLATIDRRGDGPSRASPPPPCRRKGDWQARENASKNPSFPLPSAAAGGGWEREGVRWDG